MSSDHTVTHTHATSIEDIKSIKKSIVKITRASEFKSETFEQKKETKIRKIIVHQHP